MKTRILSLAALVCIVVVPAAAARAAVTAAGSISDTGDVYRVAYSASSTGTVRIDGSSVLSRTTGYVGYGSGSNGTATVTGSGSTWGNSGYLYVARNGSGTLNVEAGGRVSNTYGWLGFYAGSTGAATVTGIGSTWTNTGGLAIGQSGVGTLRIEAGGQVGDMSGTLGNAAGSTGAATVTGAGSLWTHSDDFYVGYSGHGTLNVEAGGQVVSGIRASYLGYNAGASGSVTVTGADSTWNSTSGLFVGWYGSGRLTIADGGSVITRTLFAATSDLSGNGTLAAQGVVLDADVVFDSTHGIAQTIPFGTGGSLNLTMDPVAHLGAGYKRTGTLRIAEGVAVASEYGYLGYHAGSNGTATVTGPGSKWTTGDDLQVGWYGNGTLRIEANGRVTSPYGHIGYYAGSNGVATVTGTGSKWSSTHELCVGDAGSGTLNIEAGGQVATYGGKVGTDFGSTGTATVTGSGSKWANSGNLSVGNYGSGTLHLEAGGQATSVGGIIGNNAAAAGTVTVAGSGSKWSNSGSLLVGKSGRGDLTVAGDGKVTTYSLSVNNLSAVTLRVSGNGMIVLGTPSLTGSLNNNGTLSFYADAFMAAGTYTPIAEYAGRTMTWTGTGSTQAFGGTWNPDDKTLTLEAPAALASGTPLIVTTGERVQITDPASGRAAGATFANVTGSPTFSATPMGSAALAALALMPGFDGWVRSAWNFNTTYAGSDEVLLSFDIGFGKHDLAVWHYDAGAWTPYTPDLMTYDSHGILSFTVTDFSGYAVTGVPEPATLSLAALGGLALWRRKRR